MEPPLATPERVFSARLREALHDVGWTKAEAARRTGFSKSELGRWENGSHTPRTNLFVCFFEVIRDQGRLQPEKLAELWQAARAAGVRLERDVAPAFHSHEERAEAFNESEQWRDARREWLHEAVLAELQQDWARWARSVMYAAQMELNLGLLSQSERRLRALLASPSVQLSRYAEAEARVRLGWVYFTHGRLRVARKELNHGLQLALTASHSASQEFRVLDNATTILCDSKEAMDIVIYTALDFLGRINVAFGSDTSLQRGIIQLEQSVSYSRSRDDAWSEGCRMLEKIRALIDSNDSDNSTIEFMFDSCKDLMKVRPCGDGLNKLAQGYWNRARDSQRALDILQEAREALGQHTFFAPGIAEANLQIAQILLSSGMYREALRYALAAAALKQSPSAIELVIDTAGMVSGTTSGSNEFRGLWRRQEEEIWTMDAEPFSDLSTLCDNVGFDALQMQLSGALATVRRAVELQVLGAAAALSG